MRLIDADKLMKEIREVDFMADAEEMKITHDTMMTGFFHGRVQGIVDHLPTAYDHGKVVEQLEEYKNLECDDPNEDIDEEVEDAEELYDLGRSQGKLEAYLNAIEIVKGGAE